MKQITILILLFATSCKKPIVEKELFITKLSVKTDQHSYDATILKDSIYFKSKIPKGYTYVEIENIEYGNGANSDLSIGDNINININRIDVYSEGFTKTYKFSLEQYIGSRLPVITRNTTVEYNDDYVVITSNFKNFGSSDIIEHGNLWIKTQVGTIFTNIYLNINNPKIAKTQLGGLRVPITYRDTITSFERNVYYCLVSYATNKYGTSYGEPLAIIKK